MLSQIIKVVEEAQTSKAKYSTYCRYRCSIFVLPIVIGLAVLTGLVWYFIVGDSVNGLINAATVLIACPYALGLATPTSILW